MGGDEGANVPLDARALLAQARAPAPVGDGVERADVLEYDLGALCAFDPSQIDEAALAAGAEAWLADSARDCTQLLFNRLWATADGQAGDKGVISLPAPALPLPREKPLPKPPAPTRWAKFAQEKGIVKKKRERMMYDELQQKWMPRYGYKRHNSDDAEWVLPAKSTDLPGSDPFEEKARLKAEQRGRQRFNEERNRRAAKRGAAGGAAASPPVGVPELRAAMPSKEQRLKQSDGALVRAPQCVRGSDVPIVARAPLLVARVHPRPCAVLPSRHSPLRPATASPAARRATRDGLARQV